MRRLFYGLTNTLMGYIIRIPHEGIEGGTMKDCNCTHKTKERGETEYKSLINRLNRIEGQIRGIKRMVENNAYCTDIINQAVAASSALNAFNRELLSNHIKTCVEQDIKDGKYETVDDLISTLQKLLK